jgi:hypothetical protein
MLFHMHAMHEVRSVGAHGLLRKEPPFLEKRLAYYA